MRDVMVADGGSCASGGGPYLIAHQCAGADMRLLMAGGGGGWMFTGAVFWVMAAGGLVPVVGSAVGWLRRGGQPAPSAFQAGLQPVASAQFTIFPGAGGFPGAPPGAFGGPPNPWDGPVRLILANQDGAQ